MIRDFLIVAFKRLKETSTQTGSWGPICLDPSLNKKEIIDNEWPKRFTTLDLKSFKIDVLELRKICNRRILKFENCERSPQRN